MDEQDRFNKPSPLRNSKAVNRPFQSPLRSVLSPREKLGYEAKRLRNSNLGTSLNFTTPEKRTSPQPELKRSAEETELEKIRERISAKKRELENVKRELLYTKKHESRNLNNLTERWLRGCQEALIQFQKDICQNGETAVSIDEILAQLGIPLELVRYSVEDCDFV